MLVLLGLPLCPALAHEEHEDDGGGAHEDGDTHGDHGDERMIRYVAENLEFVGALSFNDPFPLSPETYEVGRRAADIAVSQDGKTVYLGGPQGDLGTHGRLGDPVRIVDVSDPSNPTLISAFPGAGYIDGLPNPGISNEDLEVISIRNRHYSGDVLVTGLQQWSRVTGFEQFGRGFAVWDVSDPENPENLSIFSSVNPSLSTGGRGIHELDVVRSKNRVYALGAAPNNEIIGIRRGGLSAEVALGDFIMIDITDPRNPFLAGEWGAIEGGFPFRIGAFLHSVSTDEQGRYAYLSYWDLGVVILDISDPANISFQSVLDFNSDNLHSAVVSRSGKILVTTKERGSAETDIWDVSDKTNPVRLSTMRPFPDLITESVAFGTTTVHNPLIHGDLLFLSHYTAGIRVVDISDPANPVEIAFFDPLRPVGHHDECLSFWGVAVHGDLVFASDYCRSRSHDRDGSTLVIMRLVRE